MKAISKLCEKCCKPVHCFWSLVQCLKIFDFDFDKEYNDISVISLSGPCHRTNVRDRLYDLKSLL